MLRHEGLARYRTHGGKQQGTLDAADAKMAGDHHRPLSRKGAVQDLGALYRHDEKLPNACPVRP
jgi:hypothetical protein